MTIFLAVATASARAGESEDRVARDKEITAAYQTVFFSVLEGCFEDGVTNADIDQMLLRRDHHRLYEHFIYACPICMATARALETYRSRAESETKKGGQVTFGKGLTAEIHAKLFNVDRKERLAAMHDLEETWVSRHVGALRLDAEETARMQKELKLAREEGMSVVQSFSERGKLDEVAPGYHVGDECALCNAAAGMHLQLASEPPRPVVPEVGMPLRGTP